MADKPKEPPVTAPIPGARPLSPEEQEVLGDKLPKRPPILDPLPVQKSRTRLGSIHASAEAMADAIRQVYTGRIATGEREEREWQQRERLIGAGEQSERSSEKPIVPEHHDTDALTAKGLDYIGMGFLLAPPEVLILELVVSSGPVNWTLVIAAFIGCYIAGFFLLGIGLKWRKIKPKISTTLAANITKIANSAWIWLIVLTVVAFGPALLVAAFSGKLPTSLGGNTQRSLAFVPTSLRLQFNAPNDKPHQIEAKNVEWAWDSIASSIQTIKPPCPPSTLFPSNCSTSLTPQYDIQNKTTWIIFLTFIEPIDGDNGVTIDANGATLPEWHPYFLTSRMVYIEFQGELSHMVLDIHVIPKK